MLPKKNRIVAKDFKKLKLFKKGTVSGKLSFKLKESGQVNPSKFGFVVSNKISKRATDRNALKRKLRAMAWDVLPQIGNGKEIIVFVKSAFAKPYNFAEIKSEFDRGLANIGLIYVQKNNR
ncbi:MAG: ribonuclease P protein component [Patescibacteria group bacterium]|jgi:ribonuclease P protein component